VSLVGVDGVATRATILSKASARDTALPHHTS